LTRQEYFPFISTSSEFKMLCTDKMRRLAPDQFHNLVKMHLSFLLDLSTDDCDCSFLHESDNLTTATPNRKVFKRKGSVNTAGVMEGAPLTVEGVCQVSQLIEYLGRPENVKVEGLFRKHGNLKKQQTLKERLNKGITVDLDSGDFTIHECAGTLKHFLSDLSEPLLTDAYYSAHCQVASLTGNDMLERKVQALQLLFLLIPEANFALLRDLLKLLFSVKDNAEYNKMTSHNLATVFATHLLCPRKLSADCLQTNHQIFIKATAFMIDQGPDLFSVPQQLKKDIEEFWKSNSEKDLCESKQVYGPSNSPVVNTIFSFVDRKKTKEASLVSNTDTALAELYAQVQAMPESAQKKRLISKLNDANGCGTPSISTQKRRRGDASSRLKNLLTPKSKSSALKNQKKEGKNHGSYNIDTRAKKFDESEAAPSYKRQDSRGNSSSLVTFTSDASPLLKYGPADQSTNIKTPKPLPPPRVSSLKKASIGNENRFPSTDTELLQTPRCRKPILIGLSPMLESPTEIPSEKISEDGHSAMLSTLEPVDVDSPTSSEKTTEGNDTFNLSTTSSIIANEANLLLNGEMDPSDSMTHFLDGGTNPLNDLSKNNSPNIGITKAVNRKRSITEMGGPNPLGKSTTPMRNCENLYFETDF